MENKYLSFAKIKVVGVGGGGNNAVNRMIEAGVSSADFVAVNTDKQVLVINKAPIRLQIGERLTKGLGAGAVPDTGKRAAEESKDSITEMLKDTDLVFITAGMGGGTGTGAAPVVAQIAREMGILAIAVVTKPFAFEGRLRMQNANSGINELKKYVDTMVIIPNERLAQVVPKGTPIMESFKFADDILRQGIQGISDLIATPGLINLDFADVKTVMQNKGLAHMGVGKGKGDNRAYDAVREAVSSPLLETSIAGATALLYNIKGGNDLTQDDINEVSALVRDVVDPSCQVIFGNSFDDEMHDEIEVTLIATGFPVNEQEEDTSDFDVCNFRVNRDISSLKGLAGLAKKSEPVQEKKEEETTEEEPANDVEEEQEMAPETSSSNIPAWLRQLRNKKK